MPYTPKKTVELIHQQGNDDVVSVKANQKRLYQQLQELAQSDALLSVHLDTERTRNRQTTRTVSVFSYPIVSSPFGAVPNKGWK